VNEQFLLKIQTALETSGIKTDYNKLKQLLEKDPAKINTVLDMSATKTELNKFIKEISPLLKNMFDGQGINVELKDIESSLKSVFNTAQNEAKKSSDAIIKMQKDEISAYEENAKRKQQAIQNEKNEYLKLQEAYNTNAKINESNANKQISQEKELYLAQEQAISLDKKRNESQVTLASQSQQLYNRIGSFIKNNANLTKEEVAQLEKLQSATKNITDKTGLSNAKNTFSEIKSSAESLGHVGDTVFSKLNKNVKQFISFLGSATITMGF
jgi:hypothetical protein